MVSSKLLKSALALAAAVSISGCIPGGGGGDGDDDNEGTFLIGSATASPTTPATPVADGGTVSMVWNATLAEDDFLSANFTTQLFVSATTVPAAVADYSVTQAGVFNGYSITDAGSASCTYAAATASLSCTSGVVTTVVDVSAAMATGNGSVYLMAKTCMTGTAICTTLTGSTVPVSFAFGRTYTDPTADAAIGAVDITSANVSGNSLTTAITMQVASGLDTSLPINQGNVLEGDVEYRWGITFDVDSDAVVSDGDYMLVLLHNQQTGGAASALLSDGTQFSGELLLRSGSLWVTQAATVATTIDIAANTIELSVDTPVGVNPATMTVRFDSVDSSAAVPVADALPDLGAGTAVGGNFND